MASCTTVDAGTAFRRKRPIYTAMQIAGPGLTVEHAAAQAESFGSMDAGFTTTIGTAIVRLYPRDEESTQTVNVNVNVDPLHPLTVTADHWTAPTPRPYTAGTLLRLDHAMHRLGQALGDVVYHQDDDTA